MIPPVTPFAITPPRFGVKLQVDMSRGMYPPQDHPVKADQWGGAAAFLSMPPENQDALHELGKHQMAFMDALGEIDDRLDPLTVDLKILQEGKLGAYINSTANGSEYIEKPPEASVKTFLDNVIIGVRSFAANMMSMTDREKYMVDEAARFAARAVKMLESPEALKTVQPLQNDRGRMSIVLRDGEDVWSLERSRGRTSRLQISSDKETLEIEMKDTGEVGDIYYQHSASYTEAPAIRQAFAMRDMTYNAATGELKTPATKVKQDLLYESFKEAGMGHGSFYTAGDMASKDPELEEPLLKLTQQCEQLYPLLDDSLPIQG